MASYTKVDEKTIKNLLTCYPLGSLTAFDRLEGGAANSSYRIETPEGRFVLTICDEKNHEQIRLLVDLLEHLKKAGFATTRLVPLKEGGLVSSYEGKPVILKHFIEGRVIKQFDEHMLIQLGEAMAGLHEISALSSLPSSFPYGLDFFPEVIEAGIHPEFSNWLAEKHTLIQKSISPGLSRGIIHGDVFYDNVLFGADNKLAAIIDFEESCCYYTIFDIGMFLAGTCSSNSVLSLTKARSFMKGYLNRRKLEPPEQDSLQLFTVYAAVAACFWRYRQYNMIMPEKEKANHYFELKLLADQIQSIPAQEFKTIFG